jgi:hypothetical protein
MNALSHQFVGDAVSPEVLHLLSNTIRQAPESVLGPIRCEGTGQLWNLDEDATVNSSVLEVVCLKRAYWGLVSTVLEVWPASVLLVDTQLLPPALPPNIGPPELSTAVRAEAHAMILAVIDVLLHDTTRGFVPEPVREHVRQSVGRFLPPQGDLVGRGGSSMANVRAVQSIQDDTKRQELRDAVMGNADLETFLNDRGEDFERLVTGVYRMNKAGRLGAFDGAESVAIAVSAGTHVQILDAVRDDLDCLFLHLRESPSLFYPPI